MVICIAFFSPVGMSSDLVTHISEAAQTSDKPVLLFSEYGPFTDSYLKRFYNEGIPGYPTISRVVRAARFLVERKALLENIGGKV